MKEGATPKSYAELHQRTQAALRDGSAKDPLVMTVTSRSQGGFESRIEMRDHTIVSDQPFGFEGTNKGKGPKPSELLLAVLAACQEVTWRLYADTMWITIDGISIELCGTQGLWGFMGEDEEVPAGFVKIDGDVRIDSPASAEQLAELQRVVDAHCPMLDDFVRSVPFCLKLNPSE